MSKHLSNGLLFMGFAAVVGTVIAGVIWLYLKIANVGVTLIWHIIPEHLNVHGYTIIVCLIGGGCGKWRYVIADRRTECDGRPPAP